MRFKLDRELFIFVGISVVFIRLGLKVSNVFKNPLNI